MVGEFLAVHPQVSFTLVVGGEDLAVLDEGRVDLAVLASRPNAPLFGGAGAVSYTHLTLPPRGLVEISGVAVSLKKKNDNNRTQVVP